MLPRAASGARVRLVGVFWTLALSVALLVGSPSQSDSAFSTVRIASGLTRAAYATGINYPGVGEIIYICEQPGVIKVMLNGTLQATPFMDIQDRVITGNGNDERGLLGFALHPDFINNGEFFVHYSDNSSDTQISRFTIDSGDPLLGDKDSEEFILDVNQPFSNHNGGWIGFNPNDGYLYISLGDGGSAGDPGNRAQNGNTLLGKILRIDVDSGSPYSIPSDNPFVGAGDGFLDEIWAYGIRNAWRCSFDRANGDFWIADVGQNAWEEIDFEKEGNAGGLNYGWRRMEGDDCYNPSSGCDDGSLTYPIHVYPHNSSGGFSVSGGYVSRDPLVGDTFGKYIFADFVIPENIWLLEHDGDGGSVVVTEVSDDLTPSQEGFDVRTISSFGEGPNGEILIVDRGATGSGEVFKIVGDPADTGDVDLGPLAGISVALDSSNPFSAARPLQFSVRLTELADANTQVTVQILDANGRAVRDLEGGFRNGDRVEYVWTGKLDNGELAPSGVYFLSAVSDNQHATKKVGFIR